MSVYSYENLKNISARHFNVFINDLKNSTWNNEMKPMGYKSLFVASLFYIIFLIAVFLNKILYTRIEIACIEIIYIASWPTLIIVYSTNWNQRVYSADDKTVLP